jgi:hypothetical protein
MDMDWRGLSGQNLKTFLTLITLTPKGENRIIGALFCGAISLANGRAS